MFDVLSHRIVAYRRVMIVTDAFIFTSDYPKASNIRYEELICPISVCFNAFLLELLFAKFSG